MKPEPRFYDLSGRALAVTGAFAAVLWLALSVSYLPLSFAQTIAPVWSANGVVLGALLLRPRREWPQLLAACAFVALLYLNHLQVGWKSGAPLIGVNLVEISATAWLIEQQCGRPVEFQRIQNVICLAIGSVGISLLATLPSIAIVATIRADDLPAYFRNRIISHCLTNLIMTPLIVVWGSVPWRRAWWHRRQTLEFALLITASCAIAYLAFWPHRLFSTLLPAPYLALIPVIYGALRFGPRGATIATTIVSTFVVGAIAGSGHWPGGADLLVRLAVAQLFLAVVAITGLVLAARTAEKEASAAGLQESEERLRIMLESTTNPVVVWHAGGIQLVNPAFVRMFGYSDAEKLLSGQLSQLVIERDRSAVARYATDTAVASAPAAAAEFTGTRADGSEFPVELRAAPFTLRGEPHTLISCRDLTEAKRAEREMRRINRVLRTISGCNLALVRATSEDELLGNICREVAASEGFNMAWAGLAEHDAAKTVRPIAAAGIDLEYLRELKVTWANDERGRGPAGTAVRTGEPAVCPNIAEDPAYAPWREEAQRRGFQSSIGLPLRAGGRPFGVMSFYSVETDAFDPEAVKLLQEMADSAAYGILALRARADQQRAEAEVRCLLTEAEQGRRTLLSILEDRQLTEKALEQSEERYRKAMYTSAIGMALVAPDGRWLEVNPALCRIVGYRREELLGLTFQAITYPEDLPTDIATMEQLLTGTAATIELEKRYLHKFGHPVWIHLNVSLVRDAKGEPQHFVSQIQDISARKEAEETLEQMIERLAVALRASRFGIWRHNLQTGATEWDNRMFELFGLPAAAEAPPLELIVAHVAGEDQTRVRQSWLATADCERTYEIRFKILREGVVRHLELHGLVHDDRHGRPEWAIGVAGDITEIVEATTESERLRSQLQQAQKMETLGTLAAGVAHDFNNLLTGINGLVELASESLGPGHEAADLLKQAQRGAMSARDLVRRILNFSRGTPDSSRVLIDLVDIVRDTAPLIAAALPGNVSLSLAIDATGFGVMADAGQLQQILMNLCTNAGHAIGAKAGTIQIAVQLADVAANGNGHSPAGRTPGRYLRLAVSDNGSGMDEATQKRIFEPFFTTKKRGEGTGLGLAIVRDIVRAHQGTIELTSAVGAGTTFSIYLPIAERETAAAHEGESRLAAAKHSRRVMVVDDDAAIAMVVRLALQKAGHNPEVYSAAPSAWNRFESEHGRFDLLVLDQNMPGMTGPEFASRAHGVAPQLPILMMGGRLDRVGRDAATKTTWLAKPFDIAAFLGAVEGALQANGTNGS